MPKYVVRYGSMRHLGVMSARVDQLRRGEKVVVRTQRGVEIGDVLCQATDDALNHLDEAPQGQILRLLSDEDSAEAGRIEERRNEVFQACRTRIAESGLDMKLIDVEQMLGGDRIVVYYLSEDRVDFRDLVKTLSGELRTRIEMRQVGVRDEAKLLADYGDCGKPVCCNTHLSQMPPVSMKMAKLQKATLDPNKISGRCGRLKCCLRYEYDTYEAIVKELPPVGSEIVTRDGKGRVLGLEILAEQLLIETEDHRRRTIHSSEVLTVVRRGSNRQGRGGGGGGFRGRDAERENDSEEVSDVIDAASEETVAGEASGAPAGNRPRQESRPRPPRDPNSQAPPEARRNDGPRGESPRRDSQRPDAGRPTTPRSDPRASGNRSSETRVDSRETRSAPDSSPTDRAALDLPLSESTSSTAASSSAASTDAASSTSTPQVPPRAVSSVEPSQIEGENSIDPGDNRSPIADRIHGDRTLDAESVDLNDDDGADDDEAESDSPETEGEGGERRTRRGGRRRRGRRRRGPVEGESSEPGEAAGGESTGALPPEPPAAG